MRQQRNNWWDWLKLLAAVAMVYDHWRYVNPACAEFVAIGRIAMPLFVVIACANRFPADNQKAWRGLLFPAFLAEPFFYLVTGKIGNVLFLFVASFAWLLQGNYYALYGGLLCDYGIMGMLSIWAACYGSRGYAFAAGWVLNPWPLCLISAPAAYLPFLRISMPALPWLRGPVLVWFYPVHLAILWAVKLLWY